MSLDKPNEQVLVAPKGGKEDVDKSLREKPITAKVLKEVAWEETDANAWAENVLDSQANPDKSLEENFYTSHGRFVSDLQGIYHSLGRLEGVEQMLLAAQAVEWQSLEGEQSHEVMTVATKRLVDAKRQLEQARDVVVRKLEGLMKLPLIQDVNHKESEAEKTKFDKNKAGN